MQIVNKLKITVDIWNDFDGTDYLEAFFDSEEIKEEHEQKLEDLIVNALRNGIQPAKDMFFTVEDDYFELHFICVTEDTIHYTFKPER